MSWPSLAFCGQDRPVKGNVQLFWDTIQLTAFTHYFLCDVHVR